MTHLTTQSISVMVFNVFKISLFRRNPKSDNVWWLITGCQDAVLCSMIGVYLIYIQRPGLKRNSTHNSTIVIGSFHWKFFNLFYRIKILPLFINFHFKFNNFYFYICRKVNWGVKLDLFCFGKLETICQLLFYISNTAVML